MNREAMPPAVPVHQNRRFIMFKKILASLLTVGFLSGLTITLSACDTVAGAGQDISHAGDKITDEAEKNK
jgi:predicted small secreted protein